MAKKTFVQLAEEAMAKAHAISAEEARNHLAQDASILLVDVRDESEVLATGMGIGAINATPCSLAWKGGGDHAELRIQTVGGVAI